MSSRSLARELAKWRWRLARLRRTPAASLPPAPYVTFPRLGVAGRFGNQLFQVAATIGLARRLGCGFVLPRWRYARSFGGALPTAAGRIPFDVEFRETTNTYRPIPLPRGSVALDGGFQSERYFEHCVADVRACLSWRAELVAELGRVAPAAFTANSCSVHVRRADYLSNPHYADLGSGSYYEEALAGLPTEARCFVFSDDLAWCRARFGSGRFEFVEGLDEVASMALMSACRAHVIANSSFSWWGAWLDPRADKRVVAPARWFAGEFADPSRPFDAGPPTRGYHDPSDLLPAGWLVL